MLLAEAGEAFIECVECNSRSTRVWEGVSGLRRAIGQSG